MIKECILKLCEGHGGQFFTKEDRANFVFLSDTVDLIVAYLDQQLLQVKQMSDFRSMVYALVKALEETRHKLMRLIRKESTLTDSFEIFELTLRRYLEQFRRMFPIGGGVVPPLSVIEDLQARAIWARQCGADKYFVRFSHFEREVIVPQFGQCSSVSKSADFQAFLRYMVNFPADDMVTVYKWNLLTRLFGPYEKFTENFSKICLGRGFLGLINRIKAREILAVQGKDTILIRFSRTEPEFLAFTYQDGNGIGHQINCDKNRKIIPVEQFLRERFLHFQLVNTYLNVKAIVGPNGKATLNTYADRASGGYLIT